MKTEKEFPENHEGTRQKYSHLPFALNVELEDLARVINQEEVKRIKIENKEVMLLLGVDIYCL